MLGARCDPLAWRETELYLILIAGLCVIIWTAFYPGPAKTNIPQEINNQINFSLSDLSAGPAQGLNFDKN